MTDREQPVIVWLRRDLRLADNPALLEASRPGIPVIPLYIWDEDNQSAWSPSGVAKAWTAANLAALDESFRRQYGSRLVILKGRAAEVLIRLAVQVHASAVYFNAVYEPQAVSLEKKIKQAAADQGIETRRVQGDLLAEPGAITTKEGRPYRVFSPYYRQFLKSYRHVPALPAPAQLRAPVSWPRSVDAAHLQGALPTEHLAPVECWIPGEAAAAARLSMFINDSLDSYDADRDLLMPPATSRISPYLQCGAIGIRQVWDAIGDTVDAGPQQQSSAAEQYQRQLVWREFSYHALVAHPALPDQSHNRDFASFPWRRDEKLLECWQRGLTGYPVVDAAMRQLFTEGWMPGRARMVVASFLVKHLMQSWVDGEKWFWERLIDADLACNAFNWQWVAGSGMDAAPYFRIFNPLTQGKKFDAGGEYVRNYIPELSALPDKHIHSPWAAPIAVLEDCGIELGKHYPVPIVEHSAARERALAAYYGLKRSRQSD